MRVHKAQRVGQESELNDNAFNIHHGKRNIHLPWIIDSGASRHMTMNRHMSCQYTEFQSPEKVNVGDGHPLDVLGIGTVKMRLTHRKNSPFKQATLHDVLYVPGLAANLFSVKVATVNGRLVQFRKNRCWVKDMNGYTRAMVSIVGRMYHLDCESISDAAAITGDLWHLPLGHVNQQTLKRISIDKDNHIQIDNRLSFCEPCVQGKLAHHSYNSTSDIRMTHRLELVHSDVCTMETESLAGSIYFVTFIDDFTRCTAVYFMKKKSEVLDKFKEYQARVSGEHIGTLRSDRVVNTCRKSSKIIS